MAQALVCIQSRSNVSVILTYMEMVVERQSKESYLLETVPIQTILNGNHFPKVLSFFNNETLPCRSKEFQIYYIICFVFSDEEFSYFLRSSNEYVIKSFINKTLQKILAAE